MKDSTIKDRTMKDRTMKDPAPEYKLLPLGKHTLLLQGRQNLVLYVPDGEAAYLIDSGDSPDCGYAVHEILRKHGLQLRAIFNTHSHCDHMGGNAVLQELYGCACYASAAEKPFMEVPMLEPSFLYGGAPPRRELERFAGVNCLRVCRLPEEEIADSLSSVLAQNPGAELQGDLAFGLQENSGAKPGRHLGDAALPGRVLPPGLAAFRLPGHSPGQIGFLTKDKVCFLADAVIGADILDRMSLSYIFDYDTHLRTLRELASIDRTDVWYTFAHEAPCRDVRMPAARNRQAMEAVTALVLDICREGKNSEQIIGEVFRHYGISPGFRRYTALGSTLRAYLTGLCEAGHLRYRMESGCMLWDKVEKVEEAAEKVEKADLRT